ncbi:non-ribosomal peptide synthetase [Burkholderia metallica]|uniref:non-ribosomal peptide synthetase n=1 Tax=Burkholderia metallica TaxID=488729 RepID=UPI000841AE81|nr:non-ribosomal peptide synthetase [Burkholderia metallica]AOJ36098.1 hypothetical protein WJ16_32120 [Burkholderia metallica]
MSEAHSLLASLREAGVQVWMEGSELRYRAPAGVMSQERLAALRAVKHEVVDFLRQVAGANTSVAPLAAVRPRPARLPLSYMQERLWILDRIEHLGPAYHIAGGISLTGRLDAAAFEQALAEIVRRHESLRTRFVAHDERIEQVIDGPGGCMLDRQDLGGHDDPLQRKEAARRIAQAFVRSPFDLASGPLFRVQLLRLAPDEHIAVVVMHHIVSDGWSLNVLLRELGALYAAFSRGEPSPLPELPVQYVDYALWQRDWLRDDVLARQVAHWREQLSGLPVALDLPLDRPRPAVQSFRGDSVSFTLSPALSSRLKQLALAEGATPFMVYLAALQHLLARLTGQNDIVIGTPVAGRTDRLVEGLIGFFVNTLVLRTDVSGNPTFRQLLARAKETTVQAYAHQDLPFERLVEELKPVRTRSVPPVFQVLLALHNYPEEGLNLPGMRLEHLDSGFATAHAAKRDLSLHLTESADGLHGVLVYSTDLFERATIERFVSQFHTLLEAASAEPDRHLSGIPLQTAAEQQHMLVEWNATSRAYPPGCIHQRFEAQSDRTPEQTALVFNGKRLSYGDLNRRADRLASHLIARGVGPDVLVGICVERSLEMVVGVLGILKAGGAYVPLDPHHPQDRLATMLTDAGPCVLLTQQHLRARLRQLVDETPALSRLPIFSLDTDEIDAGDARPPRIFVNPANLAYVIYTSGSTGTPKGVAVTHASIGNFSAYLQREVYSGDAGNRPLNLTVNAPYVFDMSLKHIALLGAGHTLHMLSDDIRLDPGALLRYFKHNGIDGFECTPSQLSVLTDYLDTVDGEQLTLPGRVLLGGEAIGQSHWDQLKARAATTFFNMYGPTEATVDCAMCRVAAHASPTIGRPLDNYQIYLLDPYGQPVPVGVAGEVYIAGAGLARGYLGRPDLTAEKFVPNPFGPTPGSRMYRSGDLARFRSDGNIEYLGRIDHQVKIRGFRIELGEIETALNALDTVSNAAVLAQPHAASDEPQLVAYITARDGETMPDDAQLRSSLSSTLPDYMLPTHFMRLDRLPLNDNGKIDRKALPLPDISHSSEGYVAPGTATQIALATVWSELLKLKQVGLHDNFFELGGHSLLAVRMLARVKAGLGIDIALRELFANPTLLQFSAAIDACDSTSSRYPHLIALRTTKHVTPLFCVHPGQGEIGYVRNLLPWLDTSQPLYGIAAIGFMPGETPLDSVTDMASRHVEAIRSVQSTGPYRLSGWSAGGIIAYEMARQLLDAGQSVEFLGLIDTASDYARRSRGTLAPSEFQFLLQSAPSNAFADRLAHIHSAASVADVDGLLLCFQQEGCLPREMDLPLLRRHLSVRYGIAKALDGYVPPSLPIPVSLYCADAEAREDIAQGWIDLLGDRIRVTRFDATHYSIVELPQIQTLGQAIQEAMNALPQSSIRQQHGIESN